MENGYTERTSKASIPLTEPKGIISFFLRTKNIVRNVMENGYTKSDLKTSIPLTDPQGNIKNYKKLWRCVLTKLSCG